MDVAAPEPISAGGGDGCCYLCNQCSNSFASLEELETHLASHAAGDDAQHQRRADENSPSSSDTSFPMEEDSAASSTRVPSEVGSAALGIDESFHDDLEEAEEPGKPGKSFPCRFCSKLFTSRSLLNIHYTHTHRDKPQYECEDCGRIFSVKRELATHRRIHSGEQTHACAQCGKEFGTRQLLKKHWMWHTGQRSHVCPHCGKAFFQKGHLTQHLMIHAGGRPHVCQLCNKTFIFKFDLNRHMKIHAERGYSCSKCAKAFLKEAALIEHQAQCTVEPPLPSSPARSRAASVQSTPERKMSAASLNLKAAQTPPTSGPLPLFPPQQLLGGLGSDQGSQRIVCLLCMQDFPSQAAYTLHVSYVHLRDAMLNSFHQPPQFALPPKAEGPPSALLNALTSPSSDLSSRSSPLARRASEGAALSSATAFINGLHSGPASASISPVRFPKHPPVSMEPSSLQKTEPVEEASVSDEKEEEEEALELVEGCLGCEASGPRLRARSARVRELEAGLASREAEIGRLRGKMQRVGLIAGSLLESCSDFDKLWMLHSKKVYSQIQSVINSLD